MVIIWTAYEFKVSYRSWTALVLIVIIIFFKAQIQWLILYENLGVEISDMQSFFENQALPATTWQCLLKDKA